MIKVNIATLKNELSAFLKKVREGSEILITDRREPIARIVPLEKNKPLTGEEILLGLQKDGIVAANFSTSPKERRIRRVKLTGEFLASDIIIRDRNG